jgi:signal transduction histidine kinase/CheY-like chemotaxis protein
LNPRQRIVRERRQYNQWANSQTLEDFALRYTPARARHRSAFRVGNTAMGAISFLACEAIGASLTLAYGFPNAAWSIVAVCGLMFFIGLPISYYAAKFGLDVDLLTRGAGFGYMGSTITSLIYASFTFLLLAIEGSIMSEALRMALGIPLSLAHLISSLVVIPIAIYGISFISRMQMATQPVWLLLQFAPIVYLVWAQPADLEGWTLFAGERGNPDGSINLMMFGVCASVLLSLLPQIGEQADYLRFLPDRKPQARWGWWMALMSSGPGWVFMGGFKLLIGSFLAYLAVSAGVSREVAAQPAEQYFFAFERMLGSPSAALALTGLFVVTCQLKINVTNAYAGSIAWSNFFSRLTHYHPGRVVWLVFNVLIALALMELGVFHVIENILGIYAILAASWIGALTADLVINKPLGLSPSYIEFKRAHLYDINPVGVGAMGMSILVAATAYVGALGALAQALAPFVALGLAFALAPLIAWATGGRYYLARTAGGLPDEAEIHCSICENRFDRKDMALCPAYGGPICSLCCTLEARCHDVCKTNSRVTEQFSLLLQRLMPSRWAVSAHTQLGRFLGTLSLFMLISGAMLSLIYLQYGTVAPQHRQVIGTTLWIVFFALLLVLGVAAWLLVLANESRRAAEQETERQTSMLMEEIEAHERTDAALQKAKEVAESANAAKSRYLIGISHEIRSPLNSIFGYAQLLERDAAVHRQDAIRTIRRSSEHLSHLVDGLMDISRIESGQLRLYRDQVRLSEFLDQLVDMFRLQAGNKGIEFRHERAAHLPAYVRVDQKRLRQILINLLSNAIKYTERGHAAFAVRYRHQVAEFQISDTGIGIPPEDLERIFEPFERGRNLDARSAPGTGIGLTITKLLAHTMGGELTVDSQPGIGSSFRLRLLLISAEPGSDTLPNPARSRVLGYGGMRRRVLLVDDDLGHLELVQNMLAPLGFGLFTARDGLSALEMAAQCAPDLVLLDISMPGIDGWETARRLRELDLPGLRIVMVSANAHEYSAGTPGHSQHDAFIMKPIDLDQLLDRMARLLSLEWIHAAEPAASERAEETRLPEVAKQHLDGLYQLGKIGHVRGIETKLQEMETEYPAAQAFAARLRELISAFDLRGYLRLLETARQS